MTYSEKLRDPRWQKKRLEILNRDEFTCQYCGDKNESLNVHHTYYDKDNDPWEYEDYSLVTLCESCHENENTICFEASKSLIRELKRCGFYSEQFSSLAKVIHNNGLGYGANAISEFLWNFFSKAKFQGRCVDLLFEFREDK